MFCKKFLAFILWCHCYQIVLDPFLNLLTLSVDQTNYYDSDGIALRYSQPYVSGLPITVEANTVALTPGHEIVLRCNIAEYPDAKFSWSRQRQYPIKLRDTPNKGIEELKQTTEQYTVNNNVLVLKSPTFADVGDYFCQVNDPHPDMETKNQISVKARPYILEFNLESSTTKSANVEEGKSLKIPCNATDDYAPESDLKITWHMSKIDEDDMNDVIHGEDGIRLESHGATSKTLIIDRVTKDHRRYYKCRVTNGATDNSKTILIRVKDKYTVVWPAVGIVIEIVILIGVICIVENRKVEPDREAYDRKAIQM